MAQDKIEIKVTFNGAGYRAYVKGRGITSTCTWSPEEAAAKAARKALGDVPYTMKKLSGTENEPVYKAEVV